MKKANGSARAEKVQLTIEEDIKRQTEILEQNSRELQSFFRNAKKIATIVFIWLLLNSCAIAWLFYISI